LILAPVLAVILVAANPYYPILKRVILDVINLFMLAIQGLKLGLRSYSLKVLLGLAFLLLGSSLLAAGFSGRQPLTVGLDVGFTSLRLVLLLMALFWVQELFSRDIERKTLYFVLAYPVTRRQYLQARFASTAALLLLTLFVVGGLLGLAVSLLETGYKQAMPPALDSRFILVLLGIWLDLLVITAVVTLLATFSTTPFLPLLLGLGFALAARGLGPTLDFLLHNPAADPEQVSLLKPILEYIQLVLPDLSRLDWRHWVLYDLPVDLADILPAVVMALAYTALALLLAGHILERRDLT